MRLRAPSGRLPAVSVSFGPFQLERMLGRGGMAEAFLAHRVDRPDDRVVLKRIRPDFAHSDAYLRRFVLEAQVASRLDHPGLVAFREFGRVGECHYIVMQQVTGHSLHRLLEASFDRGRRLPLEAALTVGVRILDALAVMHRLVDETGAPRPMLHRDVTPANIILTHQGRPVLIDFGIAKDVNGPSITLPGQVVGTARYMAPEHRRAEAVDPRADVFAASMVLFELLLGRHPWPPLVGMKELLRTTFDPPELKEEDAAVPAPVLAAILRGLACAREERWSDAASLREALLQGLGRPLDVRAGAAQARGWVNGLELAPDESLGRPVVDFAPVDGGTEVYWRSDGSISRGPEDLEPTLRGPAVALGDASVLTLPPLPPRRPDVDLDLDAATTAALGAPRRGWMWAAAGLLGLAGIAALLGTTGMF